MLILILRMSRMDQIQPFCTDTSSPLYLRLCTRTSCISCFQVDPYTLPAMRDGAPGDAITSGFLINDIALDTIIIGIDENGDEKEVPGTMMQF